MAPHLDLNNIYKDKDKDKDEDKDKDKDEDKDEKDNYIKLIESHLKKKERKSIGQI